MQHLKGQLNFRILYNSYELKGILRLICPTEPQVDFSCEFNLTVPLSHNFFILSWAWHTIVVLLIFHHSTHFSPHFACLSYLYPCSSLSHPSFSCLNSYSRLALLSIFFVYLSFNLLSPLFILSFPFHQYNTFVHEFT